MVNAYYNGFFGKTEDIKISLNDRAYFFGDGIYDAAIGRNGKVFALEEHLERFYKNSKLLDITLPIGINEIKNNIIKIAELCEYSSYFIYFQLTRSSAKRIHTYDNSLPANLLITATEFTPPDRSEKLKLITTEDIRYELCHIKTLNLLPSVMASQKAKKAFADEAVFVRKGIVTECSHSNIHYLKDDILFTHPADNSSGNFSGAFTEIVRKI